MLIEKQDTQFRMLTEALKDSLNNLGFALGYSVGKLSKSIDEKIDKLNSTHNSGQPEDLNRERLENDTSSSDPNGKEGRVCKVTRQSKQEENNFSGR